MRENRPEDWQQLQLKAREILDNPDLLPKDALLKFYQPLLRLWIYPSFAPNKAWLFYKPNFRTINSKIFIVREVTWDGNADYKRLANPLEGLKRGFHSEPEIAIKSIEIEQQIFEEIFSDLKTIQFPAFASYGSFGIDGTSYGIETFDFTGNTRISWWSHYPTEWQNLIEWFQKTTRYLEQSFSTV